MYIYMYIYIYIYMYVYIYIYIYKIIIYYENIFLTHMLVFLQLGQMAQGTDTHGTGKIQLGEDLWQWDVDNRT